VLNLGKKLNDIKHANNDNSYEILAVDHGVSAPKCVSCQTKGAEEDIVAMHASESWYMSSKQLTMKPDALLFGKYYGFTVEEILKIDMPYVRWLAGYTGKRLYSKPITITYEDDFFKRQPYVQSNARKNLMGICLLCYDKCREHWQNWCSSCYKESG
jgi:hypothetical protein